MSKCTTKSRKPKNVRYSRVLGELRRKIKKYLPTGKRPESGSPHTSNRAVLNGIWYVPWTSCQWKVSRTEVIRYAAARFMIASRPGRREGSSKRS